MNSRLKLDSYHITRAHFIPNHSPSLYRSLPNPIFISVSDTLRQIFVSSCLRSEVNFWESFLLIIIITHIQHPSTRYRIVYRTLKISTRLLVLDMKLTGSISMNRHDTWSAMEMEFFGKNILLGWVYEGEGKVWLFLISFQANFVFRHSLF